MKKSLLAIAVISVVGIVGCSDSSNSTSDDTTSATTTSFSGVVNKGIVSNGKVEICDTFDADGCDTSGSYYQLQQTNALGSYSITDAPTETPILVHVSKLDSTTTMKCDIEECTLENSPMAGEDSVAFGESFEVKDDWELKAVIAAANSATTKVNVNALTNIASIQAIEAANSGEITAELINNANYAVKEAFGIDGDISTLAGIDLTDPDAVASADADELESTMYSASLMSVSEEDVANIFTLNSDNGYTLDVGAIDDIRQTVADLATELPTVLGVDSSAVPALDQAIGEIDEHEAPETVSPAPQFDSNVEKAKDFLTDVRAVYNAVDTGGELTVGVEQFADSLDGLDELVSDDLDTIVDELAAAAEAISYAYNDQAEDSSEYTHNDVIVSITGDTYRVYTPVVLTVTAPMINEDNCTETDCTHAGTTTFSINELQADSGDTTLSAGGSIVVTDLESDETDKSLAELSIELADVELAYSDSSANDVAFIGGIKMSLGAFSLDTIKDGNDDQGSSSDTFSASSVGFKFDGKIINNADNTDSEAYLNITVSNPAEFEYTINEIWDWNGDSHTTTIDEEDEDNFLIFNVIARLSVNVEDANNNAVPASVELKTDRTEYDLYSTKIEVTYNGTDTIIAADIQVDYDNTDNSSAEVVSISNKFGVEAKLYDLGENFSMGDVWVDGIKVGTIEERDNGVILVTYTNGETASLF
ncbi:hypothetical protein [Vibrio sp. MA40-2]|uniref:hypothetical protein n=1 Tax=Vibrio sp. MA40-2 TaxID=3391828 RepID=UPI0039A612B6